MPAPRNHRSSSPDRTPVARFLAAPAAAGIAGVLSLVLLGAAAAQAAQPPSNAPIKWVDANGRVHYSDRQPMPDAQGRVVRTQSISARPQASSIGDPTLPWALRSAAARYPVTLYTSPECEPCQLAREHLARRGVPYTEKSVKDAAGIKVFHALGFEKALFPSLSIGPERLVGFESTGWDRALDATGYPKSSMLPAKRDPRTLAPMHGETATRTPAAPAAATDAPAPAPQDATASNRSVEGLLSPAAFPTGPNPIRF